jgi:hypothetical protein
MGKIPLGVGINSQKLLAALLADGSQQPDGVGFSNATFEVQHGKEDA